MIQLQNVNKKIKTNQVLNNISYTFEEGKVYGLYGRNGTRGEKAGYGAAWKAGGV